MFDVAELLSRVNAEARPYQKRIITKAVAAYTEKNVRSILIESPVGSGKTITALLIAKAMHEQYGTRIGWVAMRRHLLSQSEGENVSKGINVPLTYISMFDKNPPTELDMLVVDEAQHDVTGSMAHIHATVKPKYILGLSATPFRADCVKLCFDTVIKDSGIAVLIKEGYLSSYHHYTIPEWGVDEVTACYVADKARWGKSIMYFHRLVQCSEAKAILGANGVTCDVVDGSSDTEQQIADFHSGKIQVLINCMKLTEGFDAPSLKTVFCRPSCKSVTIQMCGRVLRKHPDHPYKQIVQDESTAHPFPRTALASQQHVLVKDEWRTLKVNPHIELINQRTIRALANINVQMPEYIIKANKSGTTRWNRNTAARDAPPEAHQIIPSWDRELDLM